MLPPAVGDADMLQPYKVTVTAALAAAAPVMMVSTKLDAALGAQDAVTPPLTATLDGVMPVRKKPEGYVRVTVPGDTSAPPAVGVKLNVTGTAAWLMTLSLTAMLKLASVTAPPIEPEGTPEDGVAS